MQGKRSLLWHSGLIHEYNLAYKWGFTCFIFNTPWWGQKHILSSNGTPRMIYIRYEKHWSKFISKNEWDIYYFEKLFQSLGRWVSWLRAYYESRRTWDWISIKHGNSPKSGFGQGFVFVFPGKWRHPTKESEDHWTKEAKEKDSNCLCLESPRSWCQDVPAALQYMLDSWRNSKESKCPPLCPLEEAGSKGVV